MATINVAITSTLKSIHSRIRMRSSNPNISKSMLTAPSLSNIIYDGILSLRGLMMTALDDFFYADVIKQAESTTDMLTYYSVADIDFHSRREIRVSLATNLAEVTLLRPKAFLDQLDWWRGTPELDSAMFCCIIEDEPSTDRKTYLQAYFGSSMSRSPSLRMRYPRNPRKTTTLTEKIDWPEHLVPVLIDWCIYDVFKKSQVQPPTDISNRVMEITRGQILREQHEKAENG